VDEKDAGGGGPGTPAAPATKEGDPPLVFYYSRERRLARLSPELRAFNEGKNIPRGGLIRSLTATKPLRLVFISIMFVVAISSLLTFRDRGAQVLGGNRLSLSALNYEGTCFLVLKKRQTGKSKNIYTGPVDLAVIPVTGEGPEAKPVKLAQIFFTAQGEEEFRFAFPEEQGKLQVILRAGEKVKRLTVTPE